MLAHTFDIVIAGASVAGIALANQLKQQHPSLNIAILEARSSLTLADKMDSRRNMWPAALRESALANCVERMSKQSQPLQFAFDCEEKDQGLQELTINNWFQNGSVSVCNVPQSRLLTELAETTGFLRVELVLGCVIEQVAMNGRDGHCLTTSKGAVTCRYLIDATGQDALLAKQLNLLERLEEQYPLSYYQASLRLGDDVPRQVCQHFMHLGYRIHWQPLEHGMVDISIAVRDDMVNMDIADGQELLRVLTLHCSLRQLMSKQYQLEHFTARHKVAFKVRQRYSAERWFVTGSAAGVADPLLFGGCSFAADNRMIAELIEADLAGDTEKFAHQAGVYDEFALSQFDDMLLHAKGLYEGCQLRHKSHMEALLMLLVNERLQAEQQISVNDVYDERLSSNVAKDSMYLADLPETPAGQSV